ncbi:MAG TPA: hypothetical protein VFC69_05165 [Dysgonamonadaceae bacterium]|mgnify:CR=1 FL=1|nr:hypothetical protein [Dysgonamonadaceae bacterium]
MKTLKRVLLASFVIFFLIAVAISLTDHFVVGKEIALIRILSYGLMASAVFTGILALNIVKLKPRFVYLESDTLETPKLTYKHKTTIPIKQAPLSIKQLKQEIETRWILTHFDENRGIIKFRTKIKLSSWGVGIVLKVDAANRRIEAISYPMMATYNHKRNRIAEDVNQKIETMIHNL